MQTVAGKGFLVTGDGVLIRMGHPQTPQTQALLTSDPPQLWQSALAGGLTGCASRPACLLPGASQLALTLTALHF